MTSESEKSGALIVNTHITEIPERDELHDVPHGLLPGVGPQNTGVSVEELHGREVGVAHADDDDGHGQFGRLHDGVARLVHVADDAVRDDEEREVLLQRGRQNGVNGFKM